MQRYEQKSELKQKFVCVLALIFIFTKVPKRIKE